MELTDKRGPGALEDEHNSRVRPTPQSPIRRLQLWLLWSCVALSLAWSPAAAQDSAEDFLCTPTRADTVRGLVDSIDSARRDGNATEVRNRISELANLLLEAIPDGGFAISNARWVGPGAYLNELLELLDEPLRERVIAALRLSLGAQIAELGSLSLADQARVVRDFPFLADIDERRQRLADLLLESGAVRSYLDLVVEPPIELLEALSQKAQSGPAPPETPLDPLDEQRWRTPGAGPSPFQDAVLTRKPLLRDRYLFLQGVDKILCLDTQRGIELWETPFLVELNETGNMFPPTPLPGAFLEPTLHRDLVVTTSPRAVTAFSRDRGNVRWELLLSPLFPGPEGKPNSVPPVLAASAPQSTDRGTALLVSRLSDGLLHLRMVLVSDQGEVLWNRPVGSAPGGTYLALGSAHPEVTTSGNRIYALTQRGYLSCFDVSDGALLWSVRYPSALARGSRDALLHGDRFRAGRLTVKGPYVVGAPSDADSLFVWDRFQGTLIRSLPRLDGRWWGWQAISDEAPAIEAPIVLASPTQVKFWRLEDSGPRLVGRFVVPDGLPPITGEPATAGDLWVLPHAGGYYTVGADGSWRIRLLDTTFAINAVQPCPGGKIWVGGDERSMLMGPASLANATEFERALFQARDHLVRGNARALARAIEELPELPRGPAGTLQTQELLRFGIRVMECARYRVLPLSEQQQSKMVEALLSRLPKDLVFAQSAFDQSRSAAQRGQKEIAQRFAYLALQAPQGTTVQVAPHFAAPIELAVRRLLVQLAGESGELPERETQEKAAQAAFERAAISEDLQAYRSVARNFPMTTAGRRAQLITAKKYYQQGNRSLALETLERLALFEPDTPESVDARFRMAELFVDAGRFGEARALLELLAERFGSNTVVSDRGDETVAQRAERLLAQFPARIRVAQRGPVNTVQPLVPAWRTRTDLVHQRRVHVTAIENGNPAFAETFLIVSQRSVELRSTRSGEAIWVTRFRPQSPTPSRAATRGFFQEPVAILPDRVILTDRETVYGLELATGRELWNLSLPDNDGSTAPGADPDEKLEPVPDYIDYIGATSEVVVLAGSANELRGYSSRTGAPLWVQPAAGYLMGKPHFRGQQFLVGYYQPGISELRDSNTGALVRTFAPPSGPGTTSATDPNADPFFIQEPWFVDQEHVAMALQRSMIVMDTTDGSVSWEAQFPSKLVQVHFVPGTEFYTAELKWTATNPYLLGIAPNDGRFLWKKSFRSTRRSLHQIHFHDGDLYVLEGDFGQQKIIRLELPPVFLQPERWSEIPQIEPLPTRLTIKPTRAWEVPTLHFDGEYVLAAYRNRCEVSVLSRESRALVQTQRFAEMEQFLYGRRNLYFSEFIGDTLVLITSRGGLGLRPRTQRELTERVWSALQDLDPLAAEPQVPPPSVAACAYRLGEVEAACRILEDALARPGLLPSQRRLLVDQLEGLAQQRGEERPARWTAARLSTPPLIDGSLDEDWNARNAWQVRGARYFHPVQGFHEDAANWGGWRDLSALIYTGWSDKGFHLALDVTDDSVHPYDRDAERWTGDCLLIGIDFEDDGGLRPGANDQLLTLALTVPKPAAPPPGEGADGAEEPPVEEDEDEDQPEGEFQVQRKKDGSGVIYEMSIPWESFRSARRRGPDAPFAGMSFRLNLLLTDDDTGRGASTYLSLSPGQMLREDSRAIWEIFIPSHFPRVVLEH